MAEITPQQSIARHEVALSPPDELLRLDAPSGRLDDGALRRWLGDLGGKLLLHAREIRKRLDEVVAGKVNWCGDFTLASAANNTVVSDDRVTSDCEISVHPLTADAASLLGKIHVDTTDLAPGSAWAANPVGQFTVRHAIVSTSNFKFRYSIKG